MAVCEDRRLGIPNGRYARLETAESPSGVRRFALIPVDAEGLPVDPAMPGALLQMAIFPLGGAGLLAATGTTPGKRLLGLRVAGAKGRCGAMLGREAARAAPWLLAGGAVALAGTGLFAAEDPQAAAGPDLRATLWWLGAALVAAVAFRIVPLIRWRGRMPHDRLAGTEATRRGGAGG